MRLEKLRVRVAENGWTLTFPMVPRFYGQYVLKFLPRARLQRFNQPPL